MRPHHEEIIKWVENKDSKVYFRTSPSNEWFVSRYPCWNPAYEYKVEINEPTIFGVYDLDNSDSVKGAYITELECHDEDMCLTYLRDRLAVVDLLLNSSAIFERFQAAPQWCVKHKGNWQDIPNNDPNYVLKSGWLEE